MKMVSIAFSKYYRKILIFGAFLLFFLSIFIFHKAPNLDASFDCSKMYENASLCIFNCSLRIKERGNFTERIVVTHSGWAAIYDSVFYVENFSNVLVELPKRNYSYTVRCGVYNEKRYKTFEKTLEC